MTDDDNWPTTPRNFAGYGYRQSAVDIEKMGDGGFRKSVLMTPYGEVLLTTKNGNPQIVPLAKNAPSIVIEYGPYIEQNYLLREYHTPVTGRLFSTEGLTSVPLAYNKKIKLHPATGDDFFMCMADPDGGAASGGTYDLIEVSRTREATPFIEACTNYPWNRFNLLYKGKPETKSITWTKNGQTIITSTKHIPVLQSDIAVEDTYRPATFTLVRVYEFVGSTKKLFHREGSLPKILHTNFAPQGGWVSNIPGPCHDKMMLGVDYRAWRPGVGYNMELEQMGHHLVGFGCKLGLFRDETLALRVTTHIPTVVLDEATKSTAGRYINLNTGKTPMAEVVADTATYPQGGNYITKVDAIAYPEVWFGGSQYMGAGQTLYQDNNKAVWLFNISVSWYYDYSGADTIEVKLGMRRDAAFETLTTLTTSVFNAGIAEKNLSDVDIYPGIFMPWVNGTTIYSFNATYRIFNAPDCKTFVLVRYMEPMSHTSGSKIVIGVTKFAFSGDGVTTSTENSIGSITCTKVAISDPWAGMPNDIDQGRWGSILMYYPRKDGSWSKMTSVIEVVNTPLAPELGYPYGTFSSSTTITIMEDEIVRGVFTFTDSMGVSAFANLYKDDTYSPWFLKNVSRKYVMVEVSTDDVIYIKQYHVPTPGTVDLISTSDAICKWGVTVPEAQIPYLCPNPRTETYYLAPDLNHVGKFY